MAQTMKIIERINSCLLPKLTKNYDEKENHAEYDVRNKKISSNFQLLMDDLSNLDLLNLEDGSVIISSLLNLIMEINCDCPWNDVKSQDYSKKLNIYFELSYNVKLDKILYQNEIFNKNIIFYTLLEVLHKRLTIEDFKKYPGQIEVYYSIIKNVKEYNLELKLQQVMPACLVLLDDYINTNKIKGLECCLSILKCLTATDFEKGNYYEVIYRSLTNAFLDKDIQVTKLTCLCLLELCNILPSNVKPIKLEDLYSNTLEQLYTESNLYRKAECLEFTKSIIKMHKSNCIGNTSFTIMITDNLEMCTNSAVTEILLEKTLQLGVGSDVLHYVENPSADVLNALTSDYIVILRITLTLHYLLLQLYTNIEPADDFIYSKLQKYYHLTTHFQCLEEWIKYCWSIWKFSLNYKIISKLLKVLYICKDEDMLNYIQIITVTLIQLCTAKEQEQIYCDLDNCIQVINGSFKVRLNQIKRECNCIQ